MQNKERIMKDTAYPYGIKFSYDNTNSTIELEIYNINTDETNEYHGDEALQMFKLLTTFRNNLELKNYLATLLIH